MRKNQNTNATFVALISLVGLITVSALVLTATKVSADDVVDDVTITVPISCSMSGTISSGNEHTAEIANGTYQANIGTTSIKTLCNDNAGFSIYAIGNSGDTLGEEDSTKLLGTSASGNAKIITGTAITAGNPDVSNWAMKLATDSGATYPLTIESDTGGSFASYHTVPAEYTKVATSLSGTDTGSNATGSTLTTTYAAYISKTQAADTYTGKVKYVLVHPNDGATPSTVPALTSTVTCTTQVPGAAYMQDINSSNKATILAGMTEDAEYFLRDARDNKDYCVAKLKDGNLWMTQNLDLDIDSTRTYTSQDTDIPANWTPATSTHQTDNTEWNASEEDAESYDPGDLYWTGILDGEQPDTQITCEAAGGIWDSESEWCMVPDTQETCEAAGGIWDNYYCDNFSFYTSQVGDSHYHLGNYYNWTAAIAIDDSSSYGIYDYEADENVNMEANQSICPAGWTLPKSDGYYDLSNISSGSFEYLLDQYGYNDDSYDMAIWNSPIKFGLYGQWYGYFMDNVGSYGHSWSSVLYNVEDAFGLDAFEDGRAIISYGYRLSGNNVRCLAR